MYNNKKFLVANWKMNGGRKAWKSLTLAVKKNILELQAANIKMEENLEIIICPPHIALADVIEVLPENLTNQQSQQNQPNTTILLGAQNVNHLEKGARTGEISISMIKEFGCKYSIIGHSERRENLHETNHDVNQKVNACILKGIIPIICIGETLKERNENQTIAKLDLQLVDALENNFISSAEDILIAYEPIWAISSAGSKREPTNEELQEVFRYLRKALVEQYGDLGYDIKLLYGGSANSNNIKNIMQIEDVSGVLVGAASLDADIFGNIAKGMI